MARKKEEPPVEAIEETLVAPAEVEEYEAPPRFGNNWHTYALKQRAYVKHDDDDPSKLHVHIVGSSSVQVLDHNDFVEFWAPVSEERPAEHVA